MGCNSSSGPRGTTASSKLPDEELQRELCRQQRAAAMHTAIERGSEITGPILPIPPPPLLERKSAVLDVDKCKEPRNVEPFRIEAGSLVLRMGDTKAWVAPAYASSGQRQINRMQPGDTKAALLVSPLAKPLLKKLILEFQDIVTLQQRPHHLCNPPVYSRHFSELWDFYSESADGQVSDGDSNTVITETGLALICFHSIVQYYLLLRRHAHTLHSSTSHGWILAAKKHRQLRKLMLPGATVFENLWATFNILKSALANNMTKSYRTCVQKQSRRLTSGASSTGGKPMVITHALFVLSFPQVHSLLFKWYYDQTDEEKLGRARLVKRGNKMVAKRMKKVRKGKLAYLHAFTVPGLTVQDPNGVLHDSSVHMPRLKRPHTARQRPKTGKHRPKTARQRPKTKEASRPKPPSNPSVPPAQFHAKHRSRSRRQLRQLLRRSRKSITGLKIKMLQHNRGRYLDARPQPIPPFFRSQTRQSVHAPTPKSFIMPTPRALQVGTPRLELVLTDSDEEKSEDPVPAPTAVPKWATLLRRGTYQPAVNNDGRRNPLARRSPVPTPHSPQQLQRCNSLTTDYRSPRNQQSELIDTPLSRAVTWIEMSSSDSEYESPILPGANANELPPDTKFVDEPMPDVKSIIAKKPVFL